MALVTAPRVCELITLSGTGNVTLAGTSPTGFRSFAAAPMNVGDTCPYVIEGLTGSGQLAGDFEEGVATMSATNTLTRTTVIASSNSNALVNFASASQRIFIPAGAGGGGNSDIANHKLCGGL